MTAGPHTKNRNQPSINPHPADFHRQLLAMCAQNMRELIPPEAETFIFSLFFTTH